MVNQKKVVVYIHIACPSGPIREPSKISFAFRGGWVVRKMLRGKMPKMQT